MSDRINSPQRPGTDPLKWRGEFKSRMWPGFAGLILPLIAIAFGFSFMAAGLVLIRLATTWFVQGIGLFLLVPALGLFVLGSLPVLRRILSLCLHGGVLNCFCPHCQKHLGSDLTWRCGYCERRNTGMAIGGSSFLHKCEHCGAVPQSYRCQHCDRLIWLVGKTDVADKHCACRWIEDAPTQDESTADAEKRTARALSELRADTAVARAARERLKAEFELQMEKIITAHELKIAKKAKNPAEEQVEQLRRAKDVHVGFDAAEKTLKAEAKEKHKDDPEALEREELAIEQARRDLEQ